MRHGGAQLVAACGFVHMANLGRKHKLRGAAAADELAAQN
jgi:hypothetical protein